MDVEFITTGDLARMRGITLSRVTYAIARAGIREDARAGICRLFHRSRLDELVAAVERVGKSSRREPQCP